MFFFIINYLFSIILFIRHTVFEGDDRGIPLYRFGHTARYNLLSTCFLHLFTTSVTRLRLSVAFV